MLRTAPKAASMLASSQLRGCWRSRQPSLVEAGPPRNRFASSLLRAAWASYNRPLWQPTNSGGSDFLMHRAKQASGLATRAVSDQKGMTPARGFEVLEYCSGCGVKLQNADSDQPGFFTIPKAFLEAPTNEEDEVDLDNDDELPDFGEVSASTRQSRLPAIDSLDPETETGEGWIKVKLDQDMSDLIEGESEGMDEEILRTKENLIDNPAATSTSSVLQGNYDEETQAAIRKLDMLFDEPETQQTLSEDFEEDELRILCARCYSLQHYGKVKSQKAEALMPGFDLAKKVGRKIALQKFRRPVILCVVDMVDFDGSLPRTALFSLLPESMIERGKAGPRYRGPVDKSWNAERAGGMDECRLIVVANKADLLPIAASSETMEMWIRRRLRQAGLPKPDSVHIVSSMRHQGIKSLLSDLQRACGVVGDVWVVGAQNAGKSTLINAMRRAVGRKSKTKDVTTAPLPGTTLGTLRVDGVMQGRSRMFDTPGVPHPHQITALLTPDEVRMVLPRNQIKPRSFRISAGQSVQLGGLARVDVVTSSSATLYLTVWISNDIPLHYGKSEKADEKFASMAGTMLVPPIGADRLEELGEMIPFNISVQGDDWRRSCQDVAIAGLGWIAVGTGGTAHLKIWTFPGVAITKHDPLLPQFASAMEKPGLGNRTLKPVKAAKPKPQKRREAAA